MSLIRVTWKDREVRAAMKRMRQHRGTFAPVFNDLKKPWREDLKAHAKRQVGGDGDKWEPRGVKTHLRSRRKKGQKLKKGGTKLVRGPRKLLGRLPSAVTFRAHKGSIMGVSKVPWSEIHNTGGKVGRGSILPKREFLHVSPAFGQLAADRMAEYVVREFGR